MKPQSEPIHICAKKEEIADVVIFPGDPLRAEYIAKNFLYNSLLSWLKIRLLLVETSAESVLEFSLSPIYIMDWLLLYTSSSIFTKSCL